jgi:hypothetical protein
MNARSLAAIMLLASAAGCGACADVGLDLTFTYPDDYRRLVSQLQVRLVTPGAPDSGLHFTCDDIAFANVPPPVITLRQASSWTFAPDAGFSLGTIPRLGTKLFVVEGLDSDGGAVVAGCGEVDDLMQRTSLEIKGFAVVRADTIGPDGGQVNAVEFGSDAGPQTPFPSLRAFDAFGNVGTVPYEFWIDTIDGRLAAGVQNGGTLTFPPPPHRGPFSINFSPRWCPAGVPPITGMFDPDSHMLPPMGQLKQLQSGKFGPNGRGAVAVAVDHNLAGQVFLFGAADEVSDIIPESEWSLDAGLLVTTHGVDMDGLLAIARQSVFSLKPMMAPQLQPGSLPSGGILTVHPLDGACSGVTTSLLVAQPAPPSSQYGPIFTMQLNVNGLAMEAGFGGEVLGAGCLTQTDGGTAPFVVLDFNGTNIVDNPVADPMVMKPMPWWNVGRAVAFSHGPTEPATLIGVEAIGQTYGIMEVVPDPVNQTLTLAAPEINDVPGNVLALVSGDFDNNKRADIAALLKGGQGSYAVLVALARDDGLHIGGPIGVPANACDPQLAAQDIAGGPGDELIVAACADADQTLVFFYSFEGN